MADVDLQRFVDAQHDTFDRALAEIEAGRKRSHWMWYVFPQVSGLGLSATSVRYAIGSVTEARAFLEHPVLGLRYRQMVDAVWHQVIESEVPVRALFGSPDDAKLVSSLTLFARVVSETEHNSFYSHANEVLDAAYAQGLGRCATTEAVLASSV
jgi:uncharacterized protein (DUF1810 family)